jgi:hypothetical protein
MRMWPVHAPPGLGVHSQTGFYRNHRSRSWNGPKLKYITGPINATLEQSFPARNSIRKAGCCVLLLQHAVLVGLRQNPIFQADAVKIAVVNKPVQRDAFGRCRHHISLQEHGATHSPSVEPFGRIEC